MDNIIIKQNLRTKPFELHASKQLRYLLSLVY